MILLAFLLASTADKFTVTLDDGSKVRLLAVTDSNFKKSWGPDGSSVTVPKSILDNLSYKAEANDSCLLLEIKLRSLDMRANPRLWSGNGDNAIFSQPQYPKKMFVIQEFVRPKTQAHSFDFGVAVSGWKAVATATYNGGTRSSGACFGEHWTTDTIESGVATTGHGMRHPTYTTLAVVSAQVPPRYRAYDWTFQAFDVKGKRIEAFPMHEKGKLLAAANTSETSTISKVQLIVRPIHHFTFRNVALQPKAQS
jgi:hypothetical protein